MTRRAHLETTVDQADMRALAAYAGLNEDFVLVWLHIIRVLSGFESNGVNELIKSLYDGAVAFIERGGLRLG